jgi:hypothetical protein
MGFPSIRVDVWGLNQFEMIWMLPGTILAPKSRTMACTSGSLSNSA